MPSRLTRLAAVIAGSAVLTIAAAAGSAASAAPDRRALQPSLLTGIPEHQGVLGDPGAPATLTEFVDPQCPICAAAARNVLPTLIRDYVRTGKVKLDARVLSFLGPDSVTAARHAAGARAQSRLWPYLEAFFAAQQQENSGYVTPAFLTRVAATAGIEDRVPADAGEAVRAASTEADQLGVTGTPTFVLTRADGTRAIVDPAKLGSIL